MGYGDELMVTARARRAQQSDPRKVAVLGPLGQVRSHEVWQGNPRIAEPGERMVQTILDAPGARPYIKAKSDLRWTWQETRREPGELYLSDDEYAFAALHNPEVIIEPHQKSRASPNKAWGAWRWRMLVQLLARAGVRVSHMGPRGTAAIEGATLIETPSFRHACAVLSRAQAAALPEGGLHHAAAALGIPAVVIFGGYISPTVTGYPSQVSLFEPNGHPLGCGARVPCPHCISAMAAFPPDVVFQTIMRILEK